MKTHTTVRSLITAALLCTPLTAQYVTFGKGCPGSTKRVPVLTATGNSQIGTTMTFETRQLLPNAPGLVWMGFSKKSWNTVPLPLGLDAFGMKGCTLYTSLDLSFLSASNSSGNARLAFKLPDNLAFVDARLFQQYMLFDTKLRRLIWSNAGELHIECGDGARSTARLTDTIKLPKADAINFPGFNTKLDLSGDKWQDCCGKYAKSRGCRWEGSGTIKGKTGEFKIPASKLAKVISSLNNKVCDQIRKVSGGTLSCSTTLTVKYKGVEIDGKVTASQRNCDKTKVWSGDGSLKFSGGLKGSGRTSMTLKVLGQNASFGISLDVSGDAGGSWTIANNKLSATMKVKTVKVTGSVTIPIVNKKVNVSAKVDVSTIQATTPKVNLPVLDIRC